MEDLYILLSVSTIVFLVIWLRHKYIEWQEDRLFWKHIDNMIKDNNKKLTEALKKSLEETKPLVIDINKKNKKL